MTAPPRSSYDYLGIDIYNVQNYWASMRYIAETNSQQVYGQLTAASDAPIILSEVGSKGSTGVYSRPDWLYESFMDVYYNMPRVVELQYFSSGDKLLDSTDYPVLRRFVNDALKYRAGGKNYNYKQNIKFKPSIITKDLTSSGNWTAAGTNAGTLTMQTTGNGVEAKINSSVVSLTHATAGTDPLLNYMYWTEAIGVYDVNVPHVMTFQARASVDGMALAAGGVNDSAASIDNIKGATWVAPKLSTGWREYRVGIATGFPGTSTIRFFFGLGHNTSAGTVYIDADSIKIERGEIPTYSAISSGTSSSSNNTYTNQLVGGNTTLRQPPQITYPTRGQIV